jgi:hypothetical protein
MVFIGVFYFARFSTHSADEALGGVRERTLVLYPMKVFRYSGKYITLM